MNTTRRDMIRASLLLPTSLLFGRMARGRELAGGTSNLLSASGVRDLHWSFDHSYHHASDQSFRRELLACLEGKGQTNDDSAGSECNLGFTVLPNYWSGYCEDCSTLAFGQVRLRRTPVAESRYMYEVSSTNEATGEDLLLVYETTASPVRSVCGKWSVRTRNRAGDLYKSFAAEGEPGSGMHLGMGDALTVASERLPADESLTCNWSLFDCFPDLVKAGIDTINLWEDLEKLKRHCRIKGLERTKVGELELIGYVLYGAREVPSYWWLDAAGRVRIASNVFNTFVGTEVTS